MDFADYLDEFIKGFQLHLFFKSQCLRDILTLYGMGAGSLADDKNRKEKGICIFILMEQNTEI